MIVSKSSWHYRHYAQIKWFWAKFLQRDSINENPDLCRYISTILVQGPATGVAALIAQIFKLSIMILAVIGKIWDFCTATLTRKLILGAVGFAAINAMSFIEALDMGVPPREAATAIASSWGFVAAIFIGIGAIIAALIGFIYALIGIATLLAKGKAKGASFVQLTKTWVNDGAGKRFCRTLTFVD